MTNDGKEDIDQRKMLGMEDSSMTIEFLRARLLAERSASQTAKQRAEELAQRVLELEEQLKIVSIQRKKAEKATAAVLSILENHGRSDASEEFGSGSDEEAIFSDAQGAESADDKIERKPSTSSAVKEKENDADTFSSSKIVSSPSTSRSLSWKSGKFSAQSFDRKKFTDSAWRRCSSFASTGTSPPKQAGKSCRQIRHSNTRSVVDDLQSASGECASDVRTSSNNVHQSLKDSAGNNDAKDRVHFPASEMSENQSEAAESDEDMERALQHKAQLIGQYEAEEIAQREWEEKYRENNSYTQDLCDHGNYSDVTEERDDMKAFEQPYSSTGIQNHANGSEEADIPSKNGVTDNSPSTPHTDTGCWRDQNCSKTISSESQASEFAFSKPNGRSSQAGLAFERAYEQALISHNASDNIGSILGALERAKFSLSQHITFSQVVKGGSSSDAMEHSIPTSRTEDRLGIPPGCPGLFRLPTDFQPEATTTTPSYQGLLSSVPSSTEFNYINPPSSLGLPFFSKSTYPTYPFPPNVVPKLSSSEEVFLRSLPMNETGTIPPSFHVSHYDAHMRPNLYR